MQIKKILGATALSVVVAASLNAASFKSGSYAGLNVGYAGLKADGKVRDTNGGADASTTVNKRKDSFQANALLGYEDMPTDGLILGGEFQVGKMFGTSIKNNTTLVADARKYRVSQKWKTGLHGLVGTPLSDSVTLYGKLGVLYSQFDLRVNNVPAATGANTPFYSKKTSLWGIEPGIRVSVALTNDLSAQFDANYALYQKTKSEDVLPGAFAGNGGATSYARYKPRILGVTAGLSYKF